MLWSPPALPGSGALHIVATQIKYIPQFILFDSPPAEEHAERFRHGRYLPNALAFAQRHPWGGIVLVWGENSTLKTYNFSALAGKRPTFRAEGMELASSNMDSPDGMPGGC